MGGRQGGDLRREVGSDGPSPARHAKAPLDGWQAPASQAATMGPSGTSSLLTRSPAINQGAEVTGLGRAATCRVE